MKKNVLSVALFLASSMAMAQVGIGTLQPDKSALLDVEATPNNLKGVLIPRVPLISVTDNSNINNGKTASSLLVFNTETNASVTPGYYYWFGSQWVRILAATDPLLNDFAINEELAVDLINKTLYLRDNKEHVVSVPLADINIVTTFKANGLGGYVYTSEDGTETTISIPEEVISNISIILDNEQVVNDIYNVVASQGKVLSGDGIISVTGGDKAVLQLTSLGINDYSIEKTKLKASPDDAGKVLIVGSDGKLNYVLLDDTNTVISRFEIDSTGKILELEDSDNNSFPVPIQDLNILTTLENKGDGSYVYINEANTSVTINVVEDVIENIQTILGDSSVATEIFQVIVSKGQKLSSSEQTIAITGGDKAVLEAVQIDIADGGVKTSKIAESAVVASKISSEQAAAGTILTADGSGAVSYQPLSTASIADSEKLTTDGIITVNNLTTNELDNAVLQAVELGIKDKGISTVKIADGAITTDKLSNEAVTTDKVATDAITTAKLANNTVTTDKVVNEAITSGKLADGAVTTVKVAVDAITTDKLADDAVTTDKVAADAITTAKLADGAVTTDKVATAAITTDKLSNEAVTTDKVVNEAITSGKLADDAVTTDKVAAEAITTFKIAESAVVASKISSEQAAAGTILTADGSGAVSYQPLSTASIADSEKLTTDGIITVNNLTTNELDNAVLQAVELGIKDKGISTVKIADGAVTTDKVAGNAITTAKLSNEAVTTDKVATDAITTAKLANNTVTTDKVVNDAITTAKITNGAVITSKIADEAISTSKLADAAVDSAKIAESAVVASKISSEQAAAGTILTADGSGAVSYQPLRVEAITDSEKLTTDGIITVNNLATNELDNAVLQAVQLGVKDQGINSAKIADGAVTTGKIGNTAVTTAKLASNSVTSEKIVAEAITTVKLASEAVVTDKLAEGAVVASKISSGQAVANAVLTADGAGAVVYKPIEGFFEDKAKELGVTGPITVQGLATKATLEPVVIGLAERGITTTYIEDKAVTEVKMGAPAGTDVGAVPAVQNDNSIKYQTIGELLELSAEDLNSTDGTIQIVGGEKAVLKSVNLSLADNSVSESKIQDHVVTEDKLWAGLQKENFIPVAQSTGEVVYKSWESIQEGKALTVDNSLKVIGAASDVLINPISLEVNTAGIVTKHIEDHAVTASKIGSEAAPLGTILGSMGNGSVAFVDGRGLVENAMKGDVEGDQVSIKVTGGVNKVFGNNGEDVKIGLIDSGVKERHLETGSVTATKVAANAIATNKVQDKAITAAKLDGGNGSANRVAISNASGIVTYKPFTSDLISNSGNITTDGVVEVSDGTGATLKNITIGLADNTVEATKLASTNAAVGDVLTADGSGFVSYKPLTVAQLTNGADLTSDGIITLNGSVGAIEESMLKDVKLGIKEAGINTAQLADKAVTIGKLGSESQVKDQVLLTDGQGGFTYSTIEEVQADGQDLTTDGIIGFANGGNGENAVLVPIALQINDASISNEKITDNTITSAKLNSETQPLNMLLVTDGNGGFDYVEKEAVQAGGEDLDLGSALVFTAGTGKNAVLAPTTLDVKDLGITEAKLASDAVTTGKIQNRAVSTEKISSEINGTPEADSKVLVADGQGGVVFEEIDQLVFDQGSDLTSDGSLVVPANNKSLLKGAEIKVAPQGIKNEHIDAHAVKTTNISSLDGTTNAAEHTVLTADGQGNASFVSIDSLVFDQGADVDSPDGSILITNGEKAALSPMKLDIATSGVNTDHLANLAVTSSKINSEASSEHYVLSADGNGGAAFLPIADVASSAAHDLTGSSSIKVLNGDKSVFKDVTIEVENLGVTNEKIANKTIKAIKMDSESSVAGTVLTALGDGEATFLSLDTYGKALTPDASISVTDGEKALLEAASIRVNDGGIMTNHIGVKQVTSSKISSVLNASNVPENQVLTADGEGGAVYKSLGSFVEEYGKDITTDESITVASGNKALIKETKIALAEEGVATRHLQNNAVTQEKISSKVGEGNAVANSVLTATGNGAVTYKGMEELVFNQGKAVTSTEGSIKIVNGSTSVLKPMQLDIEDAGVKNKHIAPQTITSDKINSVGKPENQFMVSDGNGSTVFKDVNSMLELGGKELSGPGAIEVIDGENALLNAASIDVKEAGITTEKIADAAVTREKIQDNSIGSVKLSSGGTTAGAILKSVGDGKAGYVYPKKFKVEASLYFTKGNGEGAVLEDLTIGIAPGGVGSVHLANKSVPPFKINSSEIPKGRILVSDGEGSAEFGRAFDYGVELSSSDSSIEVTNGAHALVDPASIKIAEAGVKAIHIDEKQIDETKFDTTGKAKGTILMADGQGGASYQDLKAAMPKFFYMPSIALDVTVNEIITKDIYEDYFRQFSAPMFSSVGLDGKLPVLPATELNYHITYYDTTVFEIISLSNEGILVYKVKENGVITGKTFMNIVLEVK